MKGSSPEIGDRVVPRPAVVERNDGPGVDRDFLRGEMRPGREDSRSSLLIMPRTVTAMAAMTKDNQISSKMLTPRPPQSDPDRHRSETGRGSTATDDPCREPRVAANGKTLAVTGRPRVKVRLARRRR